MATGDGVLKGLGRLPRHIPGKMNGLELRYSKVLDDRKVLGEVEAYWFERFNLKLADKTYYKPDFLVQLPSGHLEFHEVKGGFFTDKGRVKIKVAAEQFPLFPFVVVTRKKGEWKQERI